ncbi:MAG: hypothetical protein IJN13_05665, partial [Bacilli bacterium]|nr:hypothetical protein [Bacilli bacterium]
MQKNFDAIDIFFIVIISIYFVVLFIFVTIFLIKYFEVGKEDEQQKIILEKQKEIEKKKKI